MNAWKVICAAIVLFAPTLFMAAQQPKGTSLWDVYEQSLKHAKYVDLTHTINPSIPVWHGFGPSKFSRPWTRP
jgi:hypothetical protein